LGDRNGIRPAKKPETIISEDYLLEDPAEPKVIPEKKAIYKKTSRCVCRLTKILLID